MHTTDYHISFEIYRSGGSAVGRGEAPIDLQPARESALLLGIRRRELPDDTHPESGRFVPRWRGDLGRPYLDGFSIEFERPDGDRDRWGDRISLTGRKFTHPFETRYFREAAQVASNALVERGALAEGETFRFIAVATPVERVPIERTFSLTTHAPNLGLTQGSLADAMSRASRHGELGNGDPHVFIPQHILDQTATASRASGDVETGGILIGHLRRDASIPDLFIEVTDQIPATGAKAEAMTLTFTPEVWQDVRAALDLRNRGELMLGWWHSHIARSWCKDCPPERQRTCAFGRSFLSAHDRNLHRTIFPRAYSLALVVDDGVTALDHSLFGWNDGDLAQRDFHVLHPVLESDPHPPVPLTSDSPEPAVPTLPGGPVEGEPHAT